MVSDYKFVEQEDHEQGFAAIFDSDIAPLLQELEEKRIKAVRKSQIWVALIMTVSAGLAFQASTKIDPLLGIFPIAFGGAGALIVYFERTSKLRSALTDYIRPLMCDFLKLAYQPEPSSEFMSLSRLVRLGIVPQTNRNSLGPAIEGSWREISYKLMRATFSQRERDSDGDQKSTVHFSGIVIEIECLVEMPTIVFYRDLGALMNRFFSWAARNTLPPHKLHFPDPEVEEVFEVHTSDLDKAKRLLHPEFGRLLLDLAQEHQGSSRHVSAAFAGERFYIGLNTPSGFMDFDAMDRPLSECSDKIHEAFKDLTIPRCIIDRLLD